MNVEQLDQQQVTEDIARVQRLAALAKADILTADERAFFDELEKHRVGSAVECQVTATTGAQPEASSHRLTLSDTQRKRADAILSTHGG